MAEVPGGGSEPIRGPRWTDPGILGIAVMTTVAALFTMVYTQSCFERGDKRRAQRIVIQYRAGEPLRGLEQAVHALEPGAAGPCQWLTETLSSCYGYMRVHCTVATPEGPRDYAWDVDINRLAIHPGNDAGRRALEALGAPGATPGPGAGPRPNAPAPP